MRNLTHQTKRQKKTRARQKNKNKKMDIFSAITREKNIISRRKGATAIALVMTMPDFAVRIIDEEKQRRMQ